jgi:hypothetical protein
MKGFIGSLAQTSVLCFILFIGTSMDAKGQMGLDGSLTDSSAISVYGGFSQKDMIFRTRSQMARHASDTQARVSASASADLDCKKNLVGCWEIGSASGNECIAFAVYKERLWVEKGTLSNLYASHGSYPNFAILCANGQSHKQILDEANADYSGLL